MKTIFHGAGDWDNLNLWTKVCRASYLDDHCSRISLFFYGGAVGGLCELRLCMSNCKNVNLRWGIPRYHAPYRRQILMTSMWWAEVKGSMDTRCSHLPSVALMNNMNSRVWCASTGITFFRVISPVFSSMEKKSFWFPKSMEYLIFPLASASGSSASTYEWHHVGRKHLFIYNLLLCRHLDLKPVESHKEIHSVPCCFHYLRVTWNLKICFHWWMTNSDEIYWSDSLPSQPTSPLFGWWTVFSHTCCCWILDCCHSRPEVLRSHLPWLYGWEDCPPLPQSLQDDG